MAVPSAVNISRFDKTALASGNRERKEPTGLRVVAHGKALYI